ncbi:sulfatase-like hydrolase/transferase [Paraglaciecola sp. L3A3]|uniref:sulfatase-like hydrolase/transferase n=1 Tax=Paraglaciecola sp. L3A3 TaxID=2686358 RepID=UPI00131E7BEA|nr:sulfatase-like hydrolase/transferase [Paraglaciecola sp. L3A3]
MKKLILLWLCILTASVSNIASAKTPNILFILSDDQRADAIAAFGNQHIITPNLDALVKSGVSFRNNYNMGSTSAAVCSPSRAMILTGRPLFNIPSSYLVPWEAPEGEQGKVDTITMPEYFRQNGYHTFMTGKWHQDAPTFKTGFDSGDNLFMTGMGSHTDVKIWPFDKTSEKYGKNDYQTVKGFSSTLFADAAVNFVNHREQDKPFFMFVSFTAPHDPRTPPEKYLRMYDNKDIPLPMNFMAYHPFDQGELKVRAEKLVKFPREASQIKDEIKKYYALISQMDEQIGRVIKALKASGEYDNTYIVFASDHGLSMGSHGLMAKQSLYEDAIKAPLVISGPNIKGNSNSQALTYLYDIFPTLVDLVDLAVPKSVQGQSLKPLIQGEKTEVRDYMFNAFKDKFRSISDGKWKLIRYTELDKNQLFDLENDPNELHDLVGSAQYQGKLAELVTQMKLTQQQFNDHAPFTATTVRSGIYDYKNANISFKKKK